MSTKIWLTKEITLREAFFEINLIGLKTLKILKILNVEKYEYGVTRESN